MKYPATPVRVISRMGFIFHFRRTNRAAPNRRMLGKSTSAMACQSKVPQKVSSRMVPPADMIRPTEAAFSPSSTPET